MFDKKQIAAEIQRLGFPLAEAEALSLKYKAAFEVLERDTKALFTTTSRRHKKEEKK